MNSDITNAKVKVIIVDGKEYLQLEGNTLIEGKNTNVFISKISLEDIQISISTNGITREGNVTFQISPQDGNLVTYTLSE